ncbi:MAG TPA: beta-ketoacyl-[acyl-carrier-protein] synthase family protein [Gammaproteobacteria bacterium]|nr:beta-ketoacyl-[acyl-carrier-protein] synthase family protein [Gammaproteobacteria bacterium]
MKTSLLAVRAYTLSNSLGVGMSASLEGLREERSGLHPCELPNIDLNTWVGQVDGLDDVVLDQDLAQYNCRNNHLADLALQQDGFIDHVQQSIDKYGADRIGVFIGTSTSGIEETEKAYREMPPGAEEMPDWYRYRYTQNIYSIADFVRLRLGIEGPAMAISTACSSSAKVFASAYRYIQCGLIDAAVIGGVDTLCQTTLYGFNSLELVSPEPCRPWAADRNGISIGEAAGFALLERDATANSIHLLGYGESSDAYHMSTPHPEGEYAVMAMQQALSKAGMDPQDIDYINLHGTGTKSNDASEDKAIVSLFGTDIPCSSTKAWTGHTLGAAGITEALFSCLFLEHGFMPKSLNTEKQDPNLGANILLEHTARPIQAVMSNSFGFGGTNCSLIFGSLT